jgi:adenine-specific DNA-methyltransferase
MEIEVTNRLDEFRKSFNGVKSKADRSPIGQFLTPAAIARFMGSLFEKNVEAVRLLDPGAGAGILLAAAVESLISKKFKPRKIEIVAYENDVHILPYLEDTIGKCELACSSLKIPFLGTILNKDFIAAGVEAIDEGLFSTPQEKFTHTILNPPYKKINGDSTTRKILNSVGIEVSNLYAAFVWLAGRMLKPKGELVAITPRSFCNGPYFRRFRIALLELMALRKFHVFESRKKAFGDDDVLQENIIFYATRESHKPKQVAISVSEGLNLGEMKPRRILYTQLVNPEDRDYFIHLVLADIDDQVMDWMKGFQTSLPELGIDVSTGRLVDFRTREYLRAMPEEGTMPLIFSCHFENGFIRWPNQSGKKPNAVTLSERTRELLVEAGYYVLTKRFTTKEERRRVVAAIYDPYRLQSPLVGFENHLNYFHAGGIGLSPGLAKGLAVYLNSSLFDRYFRLFSGHTQVNATDLRKMRYPTHEQLIRMGHYIEQELPNQATLDTILDEECGHEWKKKDQQN